MKPQQVKGGLAGDPVNARRQCAGSRRDGFDPSIRTRSEAPVIQGWERSCDMALQCTHLDQIRVTNPTQHVCEDCVKIGDTWSTCACAWSADMWAAAIP